MGKCETTMSTSQKYVKLEDVIEILRATRISQRDMEAVNNLPTIDLQQKIDRIELVSNSIEELRPKNTPISLYGEGKIDGLELAKQILLEEQDKWVIKKTTL